MLTKSDPSPISTGSSPDSFMGPVGRVGFMRRIVQCINRGSVFAPSSDKLANFPSFLPISMPVVPVSAESIRINQPVPFALRDAAGMVLVARGGVVASEQARQQLEERGLYIDMADADAFKKAVAGKMGSMVRGNSKLGQIAKAEETVGAAEVAQNMATQARALRTDPDLTWDGLAVKMATALRKPSKEDFLARTNRLEADLLHLLSGDVDAALLTLIYSASTELQKYSVRHAMQDSGTSAHQREQISSHAQRGVNQLRDLGVVDELWLTAVEHHHSSPPGPLASMEPAMQIARLIKRADIFAARLSPRKTRAAMTATAAARSAYLDENQQTDEAGAAIIKATGIYPPGCFVRLASGEVAVVIQRGAKATTPLVACVLGSKGLPMGKPMVRDTRHKANEISGTAAPHEVRVRLSIASLLELT
jgi:hypothetical protein